MLQISKVGQTRGFGIVLCEPVYTFLTPLADSVDQSEWISLLVLSSL